MEFYSLVGKAVLATISLVAAALALSLLVVIATRIEINIDLLGVLYVLAAFVTIGSAGVGLIRWTMHRRWPRN